MSNPLGEEKQKRRKEQETKFQHFFFVPCSFLRGLEEYEEKPPKPRLLSFNASPFVLEN